MTTIPKWTIMVIYKKSYFPVVTLYEATQILYFNTPTNTESLGQILLSFKST